MKEKLWTIERVADYYDVSPNTVRYWVRIGKLKKSKVGRHVRFTPEAVYGLVR